MNPGLKVGFGAYLFLKENEIKETVSQNKIQTIFFEETSSTKLELQILLYAFNTMAHQEGTVIVYSDCQNILTLNTRRAAFEKNNYRTKTDKIIQNAALYKEFFEAVDRFRCQFIKLKGHKKKSTKDHIDEIFSLVDKKARGALREYILKTKPH